MIFFWGGSVGNRRQKKIIIFLESVGPVLNNKISVSRELGRPPLNVIMRKISSQSTIVIVCAAFAVFEVCLFNISYIIPLPLNDL